MWSVTSSLQGPSRNTYLPANRMLEANMRIRGEHSEAPLFFAGQLTGVEGYVESTAMAT